MHLGNMIMENGLTCFSQLIGFLFQVHDVKLCFLFFFFCQHEFAHQNNALLLRVMRMLQKTRLLVFEQHLLFYTCVDVKAQT